MESCVAVLQVRGIRSGAIKCVRHSGSFNLPGKDTSRFFDAGADSAIISDHETHVVYHPVPGWNSVYARTLFPEAHVIMVEGRVLDDAISVLVGGSAETTDQLKQPMNDFDVLITDSPELSAIAVDNACQVFGSGQAEDFLDFILGPVQILPAPSPSSPVA